MKKITYNNKQYVLNDPQYPVEETVTDADMNEIKEVVNYNANESENVKNALINITTPKSSNINVKDSSDLNAKVDVYGISEQETRSGKNKANSSAYNYDTVNYQDLDVNLENNEFTISTDSLRIITEFIRVPIKIENGTYTFGLELKTNTSGATAQALVYDSTNKKIVGSTLQNNATTYAKKTTTITIDDTVDKSNINVLLYCNGTVGNAYSYSYKNIFVNPGQDDEFEQHGASPSPEYPSNIENVGDNINVFDISKITSGSIVINNNDGTLTIKNNPNTNGYVQQTKKLSELCPDLKVGDIATLGFKTTTKNSSYANSIYVGEAWNNGTYKTITQSMLDFQVGFYGGYNEISLINDIKIEKDTKVTSYSKYKCGSIGITVCNKNWLKVQNSNNSSLGLTWNVSEEERKITGTATGTYSQSSQQDCEIPAGSYKFEYETNNNNVTYGIWLINSTGQIIATIRGKNSATINETVVKYALFIENTVANTSYNITLKAMLLNTVTEDKTFVPHKEQAITFPLGEGQKLDDGDYLASDGIHHIKKQKEFDGTENWSVYRSSVVTEYFSAMYQNNIAKANSNILCDKLSQSNSNVYNKTGRGIASIVDGYIYISLKREDIGATIETSNDECITLLKQYLQNCKTEGNPYIAEFDLIEEEIEPYTPEQQEAYNKLQNVLSYYNVTNVFTDKAQLVFKYIADTKTYVDNQYNTLANQVLELAGGN